MRLKEWYWWFVESKLRKTRLFYRPSYGQMVAIKRTLEFLEKHKDLRFSYKFQLKTILNDWEKVYKIKVDDKEKQV